MATKEITFGRVDTPGQVFQFEADFPLLRMNPGDQISFVNNLTPAADITIQFFSTAVGKFSDPPNAVEYCNGEDSLTVPANGSATCAVSDSVLANHAYLYSAHAPDAPGENSYAPLDPVVIIDDPGLLRNFQIPEYTVPAQPGLTVQNQPGMQGFPGGTLWIGTLIIGLALGWLLGNRK